MKTFWVILRDAVIACAIFAVIAFAVNDIRADGLPLVAEKPYDIFVPCPEILGTVEGIAATDGRVRDGNSFVVDARSQDEFDEWHLDGAICITYDYLDGIPEEELRNVTLNIAQSGKARLIVYGDGDGKIGSTGYELGRELSGHGIKNVFVVEGGADALRAQ